jgi:hypothetical protein
MSLINEIMSFSDRIDKFKDSIKLWFSLINDVRNVIEELLSLGT